MTETEHPHGHLAVKALALLPLVLMGAGVWYYLKQHTAADLGGSAPAPVSAPSLGNALSAPAAQRLVPPPGQDAAPLLTLDIQGSPEFKSQVTHALKLIWMADRDTFLAIKNSLYAIRSENKTDFYMDNGRPVAAISNDNAFKSLTWCAGIIAHQAWHASYTISNKKKKPLPPPLPGEKYERKFDANPMKLDYKDLDDILEMEKRASAFQLEVLKKVGASPAEIKAVYRRAPRDFTTAHDGSYSLNP